MRKATLPEKYISSQTESNLCQRGRGFPSDLLYKCLDSNRLDSFTFNALLDGLKNKGKCTARERMRDRNGFLRIGSVLEEGAKRAGHTNR